MPRKLNQISVANQKVVVSSNFFHRTFIGFNLQEWEVSPNWLELNSLDVIILPRNNEEYNGKKSGIYFPKSIRIKIESIEKKLDYELGLT